MRGFLRRLAKDERGATALEYAIIASLISIVIIIGVTAIGQETSNTFNAINDGFAGNGT